jgi:hypothetical protein
MHQLRIQAGTLASLLSNPIASAHFNVSTAAASPWSYLIPAFKSSSDIRNRS